MKYPMLANYVTFKRVADSRLGDYCEAYNYLTDEKSRLDLRSVSFARKLNGKRDPYKIDKRLSKRDVDVILRTLRFNDMLRDSLFLSKSVFDLMITVWKPKVTKSMRVTAFYLNFLLLFSWLPLLITGIALFVKNIGHINIDFIFTGFYTGLLLGMLLHEIGHAIATLGCGGKLFEMGLMMRLFIPGAYVLSDTEHIKSRFFRIQVHAAGVEANFALAGTALILCTLNYNISGFFYGMAMNNIILGLINSSFVSGLDGAHIISELIGGNINFFGKAKKIVRSKGIRKKLRKKGVNGRITIATSYIITGLQIFLPLIYIFEIVQVITCFL